MRGDERVARPRRRPPSSSRSRRARPAGSASSRCAAWSSCGRPGSTTRPSAPDAARRAARRAAARPPRSRADERPPVRPAPPSAATLCATLPAPPMRYSSWSCSTTGHRRLGRDAVDAADDELVEHHVADDEHRDVAGSARRARGRGRRRAQASRSRRSSSAGGVPRLGGSARSAANGSVISTGTASGTRSRRSCARTSPRASMAATAPRPAGGQEPVRARRAAAPTGPSAALPTNHSQAPSAGRPRSAAICIGTLCRCGLTRSTASGVAVTGCTRCSTMFGPMPVSGSAAIMRDALAQHRHAIAAGRVVQVEHRVEALRDLRRRDARRTTATTTGSAPIEPEVLRAAAAAAIADARAHPGAAREGQHERHEQRRHDERRPDAVARLEQQARHRRR